VCDGDRQGARLKQVQAFAPAPDQVGYDAMQAAIDQLFESRRGRIPNELGHLHDGLTDLPLSRWALFRADQLARRCRFGVVDGLVLGPERRCGCPRPPSERKCDDELYGSDDDR
jgi:hypothetical protein